MRRERRHLEGCRGESALRFDAGSRQSEAWAAPCTRRLAARIDELTLRRRCLDACGRGAGRVDFHRFERTELSIPQSPIAGRSTAPSLLRGAFLFMFSTCSFRAVAWITVKHPIRRLAPRERRRSLRSDEVLRFVP